MNSEPMVSVVTPFYNTEEYLPECIESILAQSYENWEYILVNNRSTDNSLLVAQEYANADSRIRIFNNAAFLSQVQNYNHALRQISSASKYCKIVQADDWIFPECLMKMVRAAEKNPTVGIVGAYSLEGSEVRLDGLPYPSNIIPGKEACRWHLLNHPDRYFFGSPTSSLIRSDLVREKDHFYDEDSLLEDLGICYSMLQSCDYGFVHQVLTFTRVNNNNESQTDLISSFEPYILHAFIALNKYGLLYLNREEYDERLEILTNRYFRVLAKEFLKEFLFGKDKKFWAYHSKGLQSIGYEISRIKLSKYVFWELMDLIRHPKKALHTVILKKKQSRKQ